jgi:hypothetical protein
MATYTITLKSKDDSSSVRDLRWLLKRLLRQGQLRCLAVRETTTAAPRQRVRRGTAAA